MVIGAIAQRDPGQLARLRALAESPRGKSQDLRELQARLIPDLLEDAPSVSFNEAEAVPWQPVTTEARADEPNLLAAVHADLDDDDARAVYADALAERGDPRGEFINLQLADVAPARKRARELLKANGADWIDPDLDQVTSSYQYRRGFLEIMTLARSSAAPDDVWERAKASPQLATVRIVHRGSSSNRHHQDFLAAIARDDDE